MFAVTIQSQLESFNFRLVRLHRRVETLEKGQADLRKTINELSSTLGDLKLLLHRARTIQDGEPSKLPAEPAVLSLLFNLPKHLQTTMFALYRQGGGGAAAIAAETGKARAVESGYLNSLVAMGFVVRAPEGRKKVFFKVNPSLAYDVMKALSSSNKGANNHAV